MSYDTALNSAIIHTVAGILASIIPALFIRGMVARKQLSVRLSVVFCVVLFFIAVFLIRFFPDEKSFAQLGVVISFFIFRIKDEYSASFLRRAWFLALTGALVFGIFYRMNSNAAEQQQKKETADYLEHVKAQVTQNKPSVTYLASPLIDNEKFSIILPSAPQEVSQESDFGNNTITVSNYTASDGELGYQLSYSRFSQNLPVDRETILLNSLSSQMALDEYKNAAATVLKRNFDDDNGVMDFSYKLNISGEWLYIVGQKIVLDDRAIVSLAVVSRLELMETADKKLPEFLNSFHKK